MPHLYRPYWIPNPPVVIIYRVGDRVFRYGLEHAYEEELPNLLACFTFDLPVDDPLDSLLAGCISAEVNNIGFTFSTKLLKFTNDSQQRPDPEQSND